jgi:hypothetical protein
VQPPGLQCQCGRLAAHERRQRRNSKPVRRYKPDDRASGWQQPEEPVRDRAVCPPRRPLEGAFHRPILTPGPAPCASPCTKAPSGQERGAQGQADDLAILGTRRHPVPGLRRRDGATALSPSSPRACALRSWTSSFIAARSSAVSAVGDLLVTVVRLGAAGGCDSGPSGPPLLTTPVVSSLARDCIRPSTQKSGAVPDAAVATRLDSTDRLRSPFRATQVRSCRR